MYTVVHGLKGAEKPVSEALHKVITNVWSTGRVPAEWKEGIIVSLLSFSAMTLLVGSYFTDP